ncbi:winged helix-turn-helix domain-containing protein [Streptomyces buecherae]|uniref:winged helix-turn-helix domain-containing protein n=1 Tax=Streptomyces buecherae TaxID=2763006 RepID=UPI0020B84AF5|nr:winged helix-turn-helix domain-containing protein [Streptomyces buecherae]
MGEVVIRVHLTAADLARVRFAPRPAPLQELNTALLTLCQPGDALRYGPWRQRLLHRLPDAVRPLRDLVPAARAPSFLDVFADDLREGLAAPRATPGAVVRAELARVYATHPAPPPPWVRDLCRGDADAWRVLRQAQHAAFEAVLRPSWSLVQDLHRAEFTRYAVTAAEAGVGAALCAAVPDSALRADVWELAAHRDADVRPAGRGLTLLPTFHWSGAPLVADLPGQPVYVTYPAGPGVPPSPATAGDRAGALSAVLGRARYEALLVLAEAHTTGQLARRLGLSDATASEHAAALRGAGLITTVRAGRAVRHRRTALGDLLVRPRDRPAPDRATADRPPADA